MIRFAKAFAENTYLTHLDLSWNSVGDNGAMILAQSLRSNETLRILDVTHDEIKEKGAFVLADMLKENKGLEKLVLSDNPIGQRGGRAVLRAIDHMIKLGIADTKQVLLSECNYNYSTADEIFDPANPGGNWVCDLADPYDRAVAWELVELAWEEDGEVSCQRRSATTALSCRLIQTVAADRTGRTRRWTAWNLSCRSRNRESSGGGTSRSATIRGTSCRRRGSSRCGT